MGDRGQWLPTHGRSRGVVCHRWEKCFEFYGAVNAVWQSKGSASSLLPLLPGRHYQDTAAMPAAEA